MQSNICIQRVLKCHFTEVEFPLKHSTKNRGLSMCLIKICQSIPCHELQSQLFVFFSNQKSINNENNPLRHLIKQEKTSNSLLPCRHSKSRFLHIPPTVSQPRCHFTNAQLVLWLQALKGISLGFYEGKLQKHTESMLPGKQVAVNFHQLYP